MLRGRTFDGLVGAAVAAHQPVLLFRKIVVADAGAVQPVQRQAVVGQRLDADLRPRRVAAGQHLHVEAAAPLFALAIDATTPMQTFALLLMPYALALVWLGPVLTAVQHLAPASSRSTMSALFLLINNLIGLGVGPYFFGAVSDYLKPVYGEDSIKYAFFYGLGFYVIAAVLLYLASRRIARDWID